MANLKSADVLGRVLLVTGPEEFLRERVVRQAREAVRRDDPEAELTETTGDQLTMGELGNLSAPSLFSGVRCVVVRSLEDTPDTSFDGLVEYAAAPLDEVALVLVHSGGAKGSGLLSKLRKQAGLHEIRSEAMKATEFARFVTAEVRSHGGRIEPDAADALVLAIGPDLRALAGAAHQLSSDFPEASLTAEQVGRYFAGRAEVKAFAIADHALYGRTANALEELRWALESGVAAPAITGSFATSVRGLAKFKAASSRGRRTENDLAREAGVPPWKVRILREQARGWDERGLAGAVTAVAKADADVKGAGSDPAYSLERMVLTICAARGGR